MIGEAVRELRGDGPAERAEVRVELPVDAHIPHDYVTGERLRLEAYTRIASIDSVHDIDAVRDELTDRYGAIPGQVENLLAVARLRAVARQAGLTDITLQGNNIRFGPVDLPESRQVRVQRLYPGTVLKPTVSTMLVPVPKAVPGARAGSGSTRAGTGPTISLGAPPLRDQELLAWCEKLIGAVLEGLSPDASVPGGSAPGGSASDGSGAAGRVRSAQHEEEPGVTRKHSARLSAHPKIAWGGVALGRAPMRRAPVKVAAALVVAGLAVSACGTVKMGAAAITGQQRISSSTLTSQVANLSAAYQANEAKGIKPQRAVGQKTQQVLTWLILFRIYDKIAAQHGITVTPAQASKQLSGLSSQAAQSKVTLAEYVSAAGALPPDLVPQLGQYFAILSTLESRLDGGTAPTSTAEQSKVQAGVAHAQCVASKSLGVQVNPQFGVFDYHTYSVVVGAPKLAANPMPAASSKPPVLHPPC